MYCCEGHDILTAGDMRDALQHHPVKGTTASINVVDESKQDLLMKKLPQFSSFHNFNFEDSGVKSMESIQCWSRQIVPLQQYVCDTTGADSASNKRGVF